MANHKKRKNRKQAIGRHGYMGDRKSEGPGVRHTNKMRVNNMKSNPNAWEDLDLADRHSRNPRY